MGLVKIGHWKAGESSHSRDISYFSNVDGLDREENKLSGAHLGDGTADCIIAEVGCEVEILEGQLCSVPYELYGLPDLKEILSLETWNSCLTDDERFSLSAYLPDMDQQTFWLTMKELLGGNDMFFGSPLEEFFERLKGGFYPPKVTHFREGLQFLQRRTYYHLLKSYHVEMARMFLDMKRMWDQCQPSISVEERVHIWKTRKNNMGMDPLDFKAYRMDRDLLSKDVHTKAILCSLSNSTKYIDCEGADTHILPRVANGMQLIASNTSGKGVLKIKPAATNSFQTCVPKSVPNNNWAQCRPAPKGVLKIVPKGFSVQQEQLRAMPVQSEPTQLFEASVLQMSRFSPLSASMHRLEAGDHGEESHYQHQTVGRQAYRSPELPDCITDFQRVEFLNSTGGPSRNLENSIRKLKRAKDLSSDAVTNLQDHNLFGADPGPWNRNEYYFRGHGSSRNSVDTGRYACGSENLWQPSSWENRESSHSSLEPYSFGTEYYQGERDMAPLQEGHITMYPRISGISTALDAGIGDCELLKTSLDQTRKHKDVSVGGSHKSYDQPIVCLRDDTVLPITYKRRKALTKVNSLDFVKPLTTSADFKSTTPKEANYILGESAKPVKIKFKNWKDKSLDKQGISNGLQHGSPSA